MYRRLTLFSLISGLVLPLSARDYRISSAVELDELGAKLAPGDVVILADGALQDQKIVLKGRGTAAKPITLRAATPGKVILGGSSSIEIEGEHLVVSGFWLKGGTFTGRAIALEGKECRVTECAVTGGAFRNFVQFLGTGHRFDHCYLADKTTDGPTVQVEVGKTPNGHRLDHNHFGPRPPLGRNGGETIRVGYSHQSMLSSGTVFESNLFDRCDGELEIISNKSCDNVYRGNTFRDCAGMFTLRHGNGCRVEGNFFIGNQKKGSGGIRVIGENHVILNNYIGGVKQGAFWITAGIPDSPLKGYFQSKNCLIAFNTIVDSSGACFQLDAGMGSSGRTLLPENITLAYNLVSMPQGQQVVKGKEGAGFKWEGNIANAAAPNFSRADLDLVRAPDGLWRPSLKSPAIGRAKEIAGVKTDIDGQVRTGRFDVGCDQNSKSPVISRPLSPPEVGPGWMGGNGKKETSQRDEILRLDRERILAAAATALAMEPVTITRFRAPLSEGGPNDFYSNGDYWWPDPSKSDGLPYIKRDGESNPANFSQHRLAISQLRDASAALAAAYLATGEDRYAAKAAQLLKVFFLDPATRMNPHLNYAQAIPGVSPGRGIGIIDTLHLIEIPRAITAMDKSAAWTPELREGLRVWFRDYAHWMTESENGKDEAATKNNHAVAYFLQLAVYADFCGDQALLGECRRRYKEVFVPDQMAPDGSFPAELSRTKPYGYSIFQLDNMATLCQVLSTPEDDLWAFKLPDGRGIRLASTYLEPYLADKSKWPKAPDVQSWDGWPARQPFLLFSGLASGRKESLDLWKRLPADPTDAEVRRNIAITQPVLWLRP